MILVTGATGTVGREVVRRLVEKGAKVRAMTRDPGKAQQQLGSQVELVHGDFMVRSSLVRAVEGVDAVFLLSGPGPVVPSHDLAMVEVATRSGVRRLVKLSGLGTTSEPPSKVGGWHLPGEAALRSSGLEWTLLRPSSFASNLLRLAPVIRSGNPVPIMTGEGKQGVIDPRDISEVAAEVLTSSRHAGKIYGLTGLELLSAREQVAVIGKVLGRTLATVDVPLDVARAQMVAAGVPELFADGFVEANLFVRTGGSAVLAGGVEEVLGRKPRSFEGWVRDFSPAFA